MPKRLWHHNTSRPTLGEILTARGYATASIAANYSNIPAENGLDRGFAHFESYPLDLVHFLQSAPLAAVLLHRVRMMVDSESVQRRDAPDINKSLLHWLDRPGRQPFFAFLNYLDAHNPYLPPPPFDTLYGPIRPRLVQDFWGARVMDTAETQRQLNAYEGAITYLDSQVGALLDSLAGRGLLETTIVVITADHGEQIGDHGIRGHANSLYAEVIHVPLLVIAPGRVPPGLTVSRPASTCDIAATVLELAGIDSVLPGASLTGWWAPTGDTANVAIVSEADTIGFAPAWTPIARGPMVSVVRGTRHYIRNGDGREELYELSTDPREAHDLAASSEAELQVFRAVVARAKHSRRCSIR